MDEGGIMKRLTASISALAVLAILAAAPMLAATKTYQVTGPVLEVSDTMIAVKKGSDRWEIARDASTKVTGDLKVGSKVTIEYRMTATSVEAKAETAAKKKK
jgi:hypothetical protein